jgi:hypothetical protein
MENIMILRDEDKNDLQYEPTQLQLQQIHFLKGYNEHLSDFKFYDSLEDMKDDLKNNGRKQTCCDVVYVQYRGCPIKKGKPDVNLLTQFTSNLKK